MIEQCPVNSYRVADKSLARPGRKQATATDDFDVHISYLFTEPGRYNPNISNGGNATHHPEFSEAGSEAIVGKPNTELGRHRLIHCEL